MRGQAPKLGNVTFRDAHDHVLVPGDVVRVKLIDSTMSAYRVIGEMTNCSTPFVPGQIVFLVSDERGEICKLTFLANGSIELIALVLGRTEPVLRASLN